MEPGTQALDVVEDTLLEIAEDCTREGGVAWLIGAQPRGTEDEQAWRELFDRTDDYAELRKSWKDANRGLARREATDLTRLRRKLQREFDAIRAIDFFPNDASAETETTLAELVKRIDSLLAPDAWTALVDPSQLTTAVLNLALNARDAMPAGGKLALETGNIYLDLARGMRGVTRPLTTVKVASRIAAKLPSR